jgi:hypothetical protein
VPAGGSAATSQLNSVFDAWEAMARTKRIQGAVILVLLTAAFGGGYAPGPSHNIPMDD